MRWSLALISSLLLCASLNAQLQSSFKKKVRPKPPVCYLATYQAQLNIPRFHREGKSDSLDYMLNYWRNRCGETKKAAHARLLLQVEDGKLEADTLEDLLAQLLSYRDPDWRDKENDYREYYDEEWEKVEADYVAYLTKWANYLNASIVDKELLESDIVLYYAGYPGRLTKNLRKGLHEGTEIQKEYDLIIDDFRYDEGAYFAIYTGSWTPLNKLSSLGTHPDIGIKLGYFENRFSFALVGGIRFLDAPSEYRVMQDDSIYSTENHTGFQLGAEMGYSIYRGVKNQWDVGAGIAYDQISLFFSDETTGDPAVAVRTLNLNAGLEYKFYYNTKDYLGLEFRYHFLNYDNNINDELFGDAFTIRLSWGFTTRDNRKRELKKLGY